MKQILVSLLAVALLTACEASIKGPSAELGLSKVKIYSGGGYSGGGFCPPGQAKKGRC
jgi:uncharacterized membrane protein